MLKYKLSCSFLDTYSARQTHIIQVEKNVFKGPTDVKRNEKNEEMKGRMKGVSGESQERMQANSADPTTPSRNCHLFLRTL